MFISIETQSQGTLMPKIKPTKINPQKGNVKVPPVCHKANVGPIPFNLPFFRSFILGLIVEHNFQVSVSINILIEISNRKILKGHRP